MPDSPIAEHRFAAPRSATARLLAIANSDTGRSRRLADFLLAWRNGFYVQPCDPSPEPVRSDFFWRGRLGRDLTARKPASGLHLCVSALAGAAIP